MQGSEENKKTTQRYCTLYPETCQARSARIEPRMLHLTGQSAYHYTIEALHLMRQSAVFKSIQ